MKYTEKTKKGRLFNKMTADGTKIIDAFEVSSFEMLIFWQNSKGEYWTGFAVNGELTDIQIKHATRTKAHKYFYHENCFVN